MHDDPTPVNLLNPFILTTRRHETVTDDMHLHQPVLVIMGVSGSGKSTVAGILATQLGWDLQEGDELHSAANVAKMSAGTPLTDEDRWPWLNRVADWIAAHTDDGIPGIITCSALKRTYRDRLRGDHVCFVHLTGPRETIGRRIEARPHHFMPPTLLDSQIATLEPPCPDERALTIDLARQPSEEAAEIIERLGLRGGRCRGQGLPVGSPTDRAALVEQVQPADGHHQPQPDGRVVQ